MLPSPKIIAIDDNPDELKVITDTLRDLGSPCLGLLFEKGTVTVPTRMKGVRIIFMDINLLAGPAASIGTKDYAAIETELKKVLDPANGPYILVTWTTASAYHDDLLKYLDERMTGIPRPAASAMLAKEKFIAGGIKADELKAAILDAVTVSKQMRALLDWESQVLQAAGATVQSLLDTIPNDKYRQKNIGTLLEEVLSVIVTEVVGAANVEADRVAAVNHGLAPLLLDNLLHIGAQARPESEKIWAAAVTKNADALGKMTVDKEIRARLNTANHLCTDTKQLESTRSTDRGAVIPFPRHMKDFPSNQVASIVANPKPEDHEAEFLLAQFLSNTGGDGRVKLKEQMKECRWLLLETQAACDHSNNKAGLHRYVLALEVPADLATGLSIKGGDSFYKTPIFVAETKKKRLLLNFRYVFGVTPAEVADVKPVFRLRDQLLQEILFRLASYGSRPGIANYD